MANIHIYYHLLFYFAKTPSIVYICRLVWHNRRQTLVSPCANLTFNFALNSEDTKKCTLRYK